MLKVYIDFNKEKISIDQCLSDIKDISDTISILLERIIIDTYIKPSPREMNLSLEEQKMILISRKKEILKRIEEHSFDYSYINSKETSDIFEQEDFIKYLDS